MVSTPVESIDLGQVRKRSISSATPSILESTGHNAPER